MSGTCEEMYTKFWLGHQLRDEVQYRG